VLAAVATGKRTPERIAREIDTAADDVERALHALAERGLAEQHGDEWHVVE
jgi:DNA-binding IclR family transcriptional regulator